MSKNKFLVKIAKILEERSFIILIVANNCEEVILISCIISFKQQIEIKILNWQKSSYCLTKMKMQVYL